MMRGRGSGNAHHQYPGRRRLATTGPRPQPDRGGADELAGTGGGRASHRASGAVRDSPRSLLRKNENPVMAAVVANLSLVMGHWRRQAEAAGAVSTEAAAAPQNGLLDALLAVCQSTLRALRASLGVNRRARPPRRQSLHGQNFRNRHTEIFGSKTRVPGWVSRGTGCQITTSPSAEGEVFSLDMLL